MAGEILKIRNESKVIMLSEYSVRKPYTVLVAVVLIIVLGIVSFRGMTTDLLPSIELPYVVVATSYPGASPEKIELIVTRPLEALLGTAGGLKNINSISSENSSTIILEYEQSTNMDSAMIELSGSIDMVAARLPDEVGTPIMLRISADMIPIVVASIDRTNFDMSEISAFAAENVIPVLERIDGVAAVNVNGLLQEQIEVKLSDQAINDLNTKVKQQLEEELATKEEELKEALEELEKGLETLTEESQTQKQNLAQATVQVNYALASITSLLAQEQILEAEEQAFIKEKELILEMSGLDNLPTEFSSQLTLDEIMQEFVVLQEQASDESELAGLIAATLTDALPADVDIEGLTDLTGDLTREEIGELAEQAAGIPSRLLAIEAELQNINVKKMTLEAMKPSLEKSLEEAQQGLQELETGKITAGVELAKAQIQLENGKNELEKGLEEFDKAKQDALKEADLSKIISQEMLKGLIVAQNFNMPAGYIEDDAEQFLVKVGDSIGSLEELLELPLFSMEPLGDVILSDIATVEMTNNAGQTYAKVNGNNSVLLSMQKLSTASTAEVSKAIAREISVLEKEYEGLSITQLMDQGVYIQMITGSVLQNLLIGGLLAILVLLVFLLDFRPTLVIAVSIPVSLLFAVTMMYFSKITLNVISLSGLALGVGMLVDNSIVVIENIYRLRNQGMPVIKAAVAGANEVAGAIFASTLTTICVFLPIVFTEGLSRQLFTDMGLTIAYSLLASLVIALTLVPAVSLTLLRKVKEKNNSFFDKFLVLYEKSLRLVLKKKYIVIASTLFLFALSIYGTTVMGTAFMADMDSPQMSATMSVPPETSKEDSYAMNDLLMERILEIEAVDTVGVMSGGSSGFGMMGGGSGSSSSFYILLKDKRQQSNKDVEKLIIEKTRDLHVEMSIMASNMDMSVLGGSGIAVNIKGQDLDLLSSLARDVADILRKTEGTTDIETGLEDAGTEIRIRVDKSKAMRQGLTVAQIYAEINSLLNLEQQVSILSIEAQDYPLILVNNIDETNLSSSKLKNLELTGKKEDGSDQSAVLGNIATISQAESLASIKRDNQARYLTVTAQIDEGYNIGLVSRDFETNLASYEIPAGYDISIAGENETIKDAMQDLVLMIILAVIFIYLIMVAQFQNLLSPFIVLFTLPLAFTGGLLLLWASKMVLSVIAVLGFLILAGIVVNNGIVYVSYVDQLRAEKIELQEALVKTGVTRLRPILMTALTTILAMSTMALGLGSGAQMMQPMAVVSIGGLTYATLLTLFVVPVLYALFHQKKEQKKEDLEKADI